MNKNPEKIHIRCITINTDASFDKDNKKGTYAFYIVSDLFKIKLSGILKNSVETSQDAEMMAIGNAFSYLLKLKDKISTNLIVINSDCKDIFAKIKIDSKNELGKKVAEILNILLIATGNPNYVFKHVKGHSKVKDARSYVNRWCDKEAKRQLKIALKK